MAASFAAPKVGGTDLAVVVLFHNGGNPTFFNPSRNSGTLEIAVSDKFTEKLVGQEAIQSKFKLMHAVMWATPEQVKWWRFHTQKNERADYFIITKLLSRTKPRLFAFR